MNLQHSTEKPQYISMVITYQSGTYSMKILHILVCINQTNDNYGVSRLSVLTPWYLKTILHYDGSKIPKWYIQYRYTIHIGLHIPNQFKI